MNPRDPQIIANDLMMFGTADPRRIKRIERKALGMDAVYGAWLEGQATGDAGKPYRNPYPAGRRHNEFKRGYDLADPMGDYHGRNY